MKYAKVLVRRYFVLLSVILSKAKDLVALRAGSVKGKNLDPSVALGDLRVTE